MRKIAIELEIKCKDKTCDQCNFKHYDLARGAICLLYDADLKSRGSSFLRLPECLNAEVKE